MDFNKADTDHITNKQLRKKLLDRIISFILLNINYLDNIGILNGKMGISILFYQYSRSTGKKIFADYANDLINEIFDKSMINTPPYFSDGLTGIGWGIEYLVQNKLYDSDTDELLAKIDSTIYKHMLNSPVLLNTGDDLFGYGFYHIARINGHRIFENDLNKILKKQNLKFLIDICERLLIHKKYLDFDKLYLRTATINSLLWFLLEMYRLELFPDMIKKLMLYLPECIVPQPKEDEMPTERYLLHSLAKCVLETINDGKIRKLYKDVIDINNSNFKIISDGHCFVNTMAFLSFQNLVYQPYINLEFLSQGLFERAYNIIDNEEDWNKRLDHRYKFSLGLSGLAGLGLSLLTEVVNTGITVSGPSLNDKDY